jgi:hypothetical protein
MATPQRSSFPGRSVIALAIALQPLGLDAAERDLVAFPESLTGSNVGAIVADARTAPVGDPS